MKVPPNFYSAPIRVTAMAMMKLKTIERKRVHELNDLPQFAIVVPRYRNDLTVLSRSGQELLDGDSPHLVVDKITHDYEPVRLIVG